MASVQLKNVVKKYPNGFVAVKDFNLEIEDKEFIIFVGPSGCGKSTTLRMVAGLEDISSGDLFIDGKRMNDVEPKDRDIAMVFQNYALYPHMTVYDNMAFGLKLRKVPRMRLTRRCMRLQEFLTLSICSIVSRRLFPADKDSVWLWDVPLYVVRRFPDGRAAFQPGCKVKGTDACRDCQAS